MKNFKMILALLAIASVSLSGCKKDDDESNTDKLTDKNWKMTALTVDPPLNVGGTMISNVYPQIPACQQDDLTIFNDNGTVTFDEGATKCNSSDPQSTQGTWTWNTNETILSITDAGNTESYTVTSLSSDVMVATFTDNSTGIVETYTVTFTKQ
jgi:hypothetical protein